MNLQTLPQRVLLSLVRGYRLLLSPWIGSQCRFEPTCSGYAMNALEAHGAAAGSYLAARRVLRCHPWCEGGHDPVPAVAPSLFGWRRPVAAADAISPSPPKTTP